MTNIFSHKLMDNYLHLNSMDDIQVLFSNLSYNIGVLEAVNICGSSAITPADSELLQSFIDCMSQEGSCLETRGSSFQTALQNASYKNGYDSCNHIDIGENSTRVGIFRSFSDNMLNDLKPELIAYKDCPYPIKIHKKRTVEGQLFDDNGKLQNFSYVQTGDMVVFANADNQSATYTVNAEKQTLNPYETSRSESLSPSCYKKLNTGLTVLDERLRLLQLERMNVLTPASISRTNYLNCILDDIKEIIGAIFSMLSKSEDFDTLTKHYNTKALAKMDKCVNNMDYAHSTSLSKSDSAIYLFAKNQMDAVSLIKCTGDNYDHFDYLLDQITGVDNFNSDKSMVLNHGFVYYATDRPLHEGTYPKRLDNVISFKYHNFSMPFFVQDIGTCAEGYITMPVPATKEECEFYGFKESPFNPKVESFKARCALKGYNMDDFLKEKPNAHQMMSADMQKAVPQVKKKSVPSKKTLYSAFYFDVPPDTTGNKKSKVFGDSIKEIVNKENKLNEDRTFKIKYIYIQTLDKTTNRYSENTVKYDVETGKLAEFVQHKKALPAKKENPSSDKSKTAKKKNRPKNNNIER